MKAVNDRLAAVLVMSVNDLHVQVSPDAKQLVKQMHHCHSVCFPDGKHFANTQGHWDVIGQDVNIGAGTAAKPQAERDAVSAEIAAAEAAGYLPKIAQIISTVHVSPCHMAKVIPMVVVGGGGLGEGYKICISQ
jgi:hypothetical protein